VSHTRLPVLFVSDLVVLPGMVVSLELDESSQAAVDAARASSDGRILVAPRLEDRYASYGVIAGVERVGRFSSGGPAAVLKAEQRGRIGSGVNGPGAALWVEVEPVDDHVTDRARELAEEYKRLVVAVLQRREAWQVIDSVHQMSDPPARSRTPPATRRTSPRTASARSSRTPTSSRASRP
jgi:ATP-dependent Lon protease